MHKNICVKPFIPTNPPNKIYCGFAETPTYGQLFVGYYLEKNLLYICYAHFTTNRHKTMEMFTNDLQKLCPKSQLENDDKLTTEMWNKYLTEPNEMQDVCVVLNGTDFQKKVWTALLEIPYGEERTYGDLAVAIGNPKAVRAVASAVGANNIAIFIPCHRVKAKTGDLHKYRWGGELKRRILLNEQGGK